jgi:hypothetical protein
MQTEFVKVFVYVPTSPMKRSIDGRDFPDPLAAILSVLNEHRDRGVAVVGNYDNVSFTFLPGASRYRAIPGSSATPTKGALGELHTENEVLLTFTAPKDGLPFLLTALKENHPYETPVMDVFDLVRHEHDALSN